MQLPAVGGWISLPWIGSRASAYDRLFRMDISCLGFLGTGNKTLVIFKVDEFSSHYHL